MPNNFDFIWFSASSVVTMKYKKLFHSITLTFVTFKQENTFRHDNTCPWPQLVRRERYHLKAENLARNLCNAINSNWTNDFSDVVYGSDWTNYFPNMRKHHSRLWLARTHLHTKFTTWLSWLSLGCTGNSSGVMSFWLYSVGIITLKNIYMNKTTTLHAYRTF